MKNKVLAAVEQYNMLNKGDTVVVGVSGGGDSMALLHLLTSVADKYELQVIAAHFNHGIRGQQADEDEQFVAAFCKENGIAFVRGYCDIPARAKQLQIGLEECGRMERYAFLQQVAKGAKIATAHTLSDSAESFLLNFTRGTGLNGLCGIPPVRDNIIRPLIFCTTQDVRSYNEANGIAWREDASNADLSYARNRIRHCVTPSLKMLNEAYESNAMRCMQLLQEDSLYLNELAEQAFADCRQDGNKLSLDKLASYPQAISSRVLMLFAASLSCENISYRQIAFLRNLQENECITLYGKKVIQRKSNCLQLYEPVIPDADVSVCVTAEQTLYPFFDDIVEIKTIPYHPSAVIDYKNIADADKIGNMVLRNRRAGDALRIQKRNCTKSFKNLCNENAVSVSDRSRLPIAADEHGVIWIAGFGVDASRLPDKHTKNILVFEWRKNYVE